MFWCANVTSFALVTFVSLIIITPKQLNNRPYSTVGEISHLECDDACIPNDKRKESGRNYICDTECGDGTRIRGICSDVGNAVFSNTPIPPPPRLKVDDRSLYDKPHQHPFYRTTSGSNLGHQPSAGNFPIYFRPKSFSFTTSRLGLMYTDNHFTTNLDDHHSKYKTSP